MTKLPWVSTLLIFIRRVIVFLKLFNLLFFISVIHYLNNVKLMGSRLSIAPYKFEHLKLTRQDFESNLCKDLTKPGKVKLHRYYDHNKWDLSKLTPPCQSLMISNVL